MLGLGGEVCFKNDRPSLNGMDVMLQSLPQSAQGHRHVHLSGAICFGAVTLGQKQGPKSYSELGLSLCFQGSICNTPELLEELASQGVTLASDDIRNIIAGAFTLWGLDCFERLEGRFVIAIYEHLRGRFILARDVMGQEPVYITHDEAAGRVIFGTTLPMIARRDDVSGEIDPLSLNMYCSYQSAVPAPFTLLRAVKKLPAGCVATFDSDGTRSNHIFRSIPFDLHTEHESFEAEDWAAVVKDQLKLGFQKLATDDRPILLEIGEVGKLLQEHIGRPTSAYALSLEGYRDPHLAQLTENWDGDVQPIMLTRREVFEALPDALRAMSEPAPYSNGIYRFAAHQKLGVDGFLCVESHGLVEALGAHSWYQNLSGSNDLSRDYAKYVFDRDYGEFKRQISAPYLDEDFAQSFLTGYFDGDDAAQPLEKVLRFDLLNKVVEGPANWNTHYQHALGAESLRPFLSPAMVALLAAVPVDLKIGDKKLAKALIPDRPAAITAQRLPSLVQFLNGSICDFFYDVFHSQQARERQIFNTAYIDHLLDQPERHLTPTGGSKLLQAAVIELWFQTHGL